MTEHSEPENDIVTTEEEKEAYFIVKSILREKIPGERIQYRDTKSYFGILLDDNNRKPLARLRFNAQTVKYIGVFDEEKNETKIPLETLDDIYKHKESLLKIADIYLKQEMET